MGGQSQQRNGVKKMRSIHAGHGNNNAGQPQAAAAQPLPAATTALPTATATMAATTSAATPAASAPAAPGAGWLGRCAAPMAPCTCGLNPSRLDKKPSGKRESCHHVTPRVEASECQACAKTEGGHRAAHHLGCLLSVYNGKTHGRIYEDQEAKKSSRPPTAKDAQGTHKLGAFSAFRTSASAAEEVQKKALAVKSKEKRGHVPVDSDRDGSADDGL